MPTTICKQPLRGSKVYKHVHVLQSEKWSTAFETGEREAGPKGKVIACQTSLSRSKRSRRRGEEFGRHRPEREHSWLRNRRWRRIQARTFDLPSHVGCRRGSCKRRRPRSRWRSKCPLGRPGGASLKRVALQRDLMGRRLTAIGTIRFSADQFRGATLL